MNGFFLIRILVLYCQHAVYCKGWYLSLFIIGPFPGVCVFFFFLFFLFFS